MEDLALVIIMVAAFLWIFEDEIFKCKKYDKQGTGEVYEDGPEETESGKKKKS